ncbi:MAG: trigger factor, partial [Gammaproteobacteria bacterium]|nr:trigger factor [Gammaproteobacteria bacterium]
INEIISKNDLKADPDRVRATIEAAAAAYDEPEEMVNWYYSNPQHLQQIESTVVEEQVVDLILESATVSEKTYSFDDLMNKKS